MRGSGDFTFYRGESVGRNYVVVGPPSRWFLFVCRGICRTSGCYKRIGTGSMYLPFYGGSSVTILSSSSRRSKELFCCVIKLLHNHLEGIAKLETIYVGLQWVFYLNENCFGISLLVCNADGCQVFLGWLFPTNWICRFL